MTGIVYELLIVFRWLYFVQMVFAVKPNYEANGMFVTLDLVHLACKVKTIQTYGQSLLPGFCL